MPQHHYNPTIEYVSGSQPRVGSPQMGHKINLKGHCMINVIEEFENGSIIVPFCPLKILNTVLVEKYETRDKQ